MLQVPAERGDATILEAMLACGFDAHARDGEGVTGLHRAAMFGRAEAVSVLLANGAPVNALDGFVRATPLVWAAGGWSFGSQAPGADHLRVARQLSAAGSSTQWIAPEKAPDPERTQEQLLELLRAAAA